MAYAIWTFGRSNDPNRQAAVMLYVHSLMGDAAAGRSRPERSRPRPPALYEQIAHDSARYHGPYRIDVRLPGTLSVGQQARRPSACSPRAAPAFPAST